MKSFDKVVRESGTKGPGRDRFVRGKRVTITGNSSNHNYGDVGDSFTIGPKAFASQTYMKKAKPDGTGNTIKYIDLALGTLTKKELLDRKDKLTQNYKEKIEKIDRKIEFLEETGEEEFDEQTYKTFTALKVLQDGNSSTMQKAKKLAELI